MTALYQNLLNMQQQWVEIFKNINRILSQRSKIVSQFYGRILGVAYVFHLDKNDELGIDTHDHYNHYKASLPWKYH